MFLSRASAVAQASRLIPLGQRRLFSSVERLRDRDLTQESGKLPPQSASLSSVKEALDVEDKQNQHGFTSESDQAFSLFSPIPKQLMDGSQQDGKVPAALISGAPTELQARSVRIYRPSKPATQSGNWHGRQWRMDWDILPKGHRWENDLMGWQSSADFMQGTHMTFKSREDAIAFAEKQGFEYFVQEPNSRKTMPKAYANNFLWSEKKLKHIRTK
ncbi:NADH dehydrogenase iron-sulfur protein 4,mitochondrial precursor [Blumeria hordei DH14]|uniref:NADH dehydrogenase [ubiquinone] iron-sulfur protein 4, mitochondrial n=1 Tax=Blumeria graminis f. sp. hordei (strain DH14) TaxID=546991 RepID=N1J6T2_BLUG1|nr:NADH dehydrogenase iron-sulfur protein 4,mitochondrial precursor [Blumeria hordei DH14]